MSSSLIITGENNESYIGYEDLVSYLRERKNKSYRGFLHRNREIVVEYTFYTETTAWKDLDNFWALKFLKEAEELDINTFDTLNKKVRFFYFAKEGNS